MGVLCCREEEIDYDNVDVELSHFHLLRSVGKGAFGKVRIVQHKRDKRNYALKYINKEKCVKMKAVENVIQERRLLEEIQYPLVCNLRFAFQDDENLFMVLDLMLGGDLRFHLDRRQGGLPENYVRFYTAEIACSLNYLHAKRIVHRDLKPDNVLLDESGHAHLTDFNIAVRYNTKPLTAVAGSMAYMAPEVLRKKGYFSSVDWWSCGVVAYELLFGKRPYRGKTNSALTQAILTEDLKFPSDAESKVSPECIAALRGLICRDIDQRLGCGPDGFENIKAHPWFAGMDWKLMESKGVEPPFTPDTKHANFDATHELEELLLEDNPLKVKKRAKTKPGQEPPTLSKDQRTMEEKFTVYDWSKAALAKKRKESMQRKEKLKRQQESGMDSDVGGESYADLGGFERDDTVGDDVEKDSMVEPRSGVSRASDLEVKEESSSGNPYQRKEMN